MTTPSQSRDATATIRGCMYQFDATIRAILKQPKGKQLDVEGIEDLDIGGDDPTDLFRCNYYAALARHTSPDTVFPEQLNVQRKVCRLIPFLLSAFLAKQG